MATRQTTPTRRNQTWRSPAPTIYRGYIIDHNVTGDLFFVRRDGFTITTQSSESDARAAIDAVVGA